MRINFDANFREVQKLLNVKAKPADAGPEFQKLLADVAPKRSEVSEVTQKFTKTEKAAEEREDDTRASFNFDAPRLLMPEADLLASQMQGPSPDKHSSQSVKTPTIISARRLQEAQEFDSLGRNEKIGSVKELVKEYGLKHGVDPNLSLAVVSAESSFNAAAVSADGHNSKGLMQLLDSTGKELHAQNEASEEYQPFNPRLNVDLGVKYLRKLHDIFSQPTLLPGQASTVAAANSSALEKLALAAYNAGEGRVANAQQRAKEAGKDASLYEQIETYLPETTQEYVRKVLRFKADFESHFIG